MLTLTSVSQSLCYFVYCILCAIIYLKIDQNLKCYNQCIFLCTRIGLAKSVQICKQPIKFGQASSTDTAMPILMKQIAMY